MGKINSVISEEMLFDGGDNSLPLSPPITKRRKISALRDFPDGCGPSSTQNSMQKKEVQVSGQKEGDVQIHVECVGEKGRGLCEVEGDKFLEAFERHDDMPVCPYGVKMAASSLVNCDTAEDVNRELLEMPPVNRKPPSARKNTGILDVKEPADALKHELVDEGTSVEHCSLPHYPIPPNIVWKEQRYSTQESAFPVRDFPAGYGPRACRLGETQDKHLGQCETVSSIQEAVVVNEVNQIEEDPDADNASKDKIQQSVILRKHGNVPKDPFESHKGDKGRDLFFEDNNDDQGKGMKQSENDGKEIIIPIKDKIMKKKSIRLSSSNKERGVVIVQGLMSAPNCPWRQGKGAFRFSSSIVGVKTKEGMQHSSGRNKQKFPPASPNSEARLKVRDTLRLFNGVLRKLVQAEEKKKKGRVDASIQIINAIKIFKDHGKYINTNKLMGPIPGVEVGDVFNYRAELAIIGLHKPLQSGIDFVKLDKKIIAVSIVASGRYDNDVDNSDVLIYMGQGGNVAGGCKQLEDQKLERGNLALKNSIDEKNSVRVIRGFKERKQSGGKRTTIPSYTYDGLFTVERYWRESGPHGRLIYKFELRRVQHQPELPRKKVKQSKKSKIREDCCGDDISNGKEIPICAVNNIDDEKPPVFTYITAMMYPDWCQPLPLRGCNCTDGCSDSKHCACVAKNGGEIPYNHSGAIVEPKPLVYECGPSCKCPPSCHNRVSQHGIKLPLEIFKTESRGWGVRCLSLIPSGSFVCEYIGELLDDEEAEQRIGYDEYLFDIGQNYENSTLRDEVSALIPDIQLSCGDVVEDVGFTIDAANYGNIGRFINHSCSPNLYAQNVLYDHEDKRIPHIIMFALENIPPLQELTYHYNYKVDQVFDSEGNIKKKRCYCGSTECIGWLY